ncbi:methyl-accepting chemotaxis protein [Methanosphaerula palustris]|uniref:Methyl-accepting chemotaxis sensory transducer n=1 Tax=Methanosphaerula palustris (strain ATCC BAA-1556 / DSM 19958 / E1-9c) TaxID=521011 RepID=B8GJH4_METPE|nr:methyl-accepting chemotaxis protein [Methanosphaerula palustris]ACL17015.1 methyl-accepting chemotaxis sensory transducer [Methanosphaerula palustris E1-9c]
MDPNENTKELEITKEKAQQFELLSAGQKKAVTDILFIAEKAKGGDLSARIDLANHTGDFKMIAEGINTLLDVFTEKNSWYKAIIDAVPFPIHVTDLDMKWTLMNAAFEKTLIEQGAIKNRDTSMGLPCSTANATICNTEGCGIRQLHKGVTESYFVWGEMNGKQTTSSLRDQKGNQIGYVEVVQDLTSVIAVRDFTKAEVDRMATNLALLAKGNLNFDLTVKPANKFTQAEHDDFVKMNENLQEAQLAISGLINDAEMLANAAVEGKLSIRADATKHQGDYEKIIEGFNQTLDAVIGPLNIAADFVAKISAGIAPEKITADYQGDFNVLMHNLNQQIDVIVMRNTELDMLIEAAIEGKLATRADPSKFQGGNKKMMVGLNAMLDAIIAPLNVAIDYYNKIGIGDIPEKRTNKVNGDIIAMQKSINNCIDNINALVADANMLSVAAVEGKLATRADATKHQGDYRKIIEGVNQTLDAVITPLNLAAECIDRISKGDIPDKTNRQLNGDFNTLHINLNNLIDNINALVTDANLLAEGAIEGKLANRADTTRHQGDYREVIEGFNRTLDAIIAPLNVAINGYDKIGKGDIPEKRTNKVTGDIIGMQKSMNACIDNINALVTDANLLAEAAIEGKLANRADATRHQGDYRKIIEGFNKTLDAVIEPVDEAMRVAHEFSEYNYQARMDKNLRVAGDFVKFRDALDNIGISVSAAIGDINNHVTDLAASAEEANASIEEVVSGAQQVAESAGKVSSNAEKGNQGLEQVLKAMEDLSAAVEEVTASSESVANLANSANTLSKDGAELARKAEQGMVGITRSTTEVDQIIGEIKSEMQKIGKIVGLISDLANQTNLLALNAAIEAARAGDAGRGFAVVAAEVKSLAQESRTSAESIAEMIGGLQHKSELAAQATASASKEVGEGSAVLSETLNVFNRIVADVEKITRSVEEVASASEEQAATVEEITASVHEVSSLVDGTASDAGDAAAASEESSAAIDEVGKIIENVNVIVDSVSSGINKFRV